MLIPIDLTWDFLRPSEHTGQMIRVFFSCDSTTCSKFISVFSTFFQRHEPPFPGGRLQPSVLSCPQALQLATGTAFMGTEVHALLTQVQSGLAECLRTATHHVVRGTQSVGFLLALSGGKDVPPPLTCGSPDRRHRRGIVYPRRSRYDLSRLLCRNSRLLSLHPTVKPSGGNLWGLFYFSLDSVRTYGVYRHTVRGRYAVRCTNRHVSDVSDTLNTSISARGLSLSNPQ